MRVSVLSLVILATTCPGMVAASVCEGFFELGMQDITRTYDSETLREAAAKHHCYAEDDQIWFKDNASFDYFKVLGATASPDFGKRDKERWCRNNKSYLSKDTIEYEEVHTFNKNALAAFERCLEIEDRDIKIAFDFEGDLLVFDIHSDTGRTDTALTDFDYKSGKLDCSAIKVSLDEGSRQPISDLGNSIVRLEEDYRVTIKCRRTLIDRDGYSYYPETVVSISTNLEDSLVVALPRDPVLANSTVREINGALAEIREWQASLRPELGQSCKKEVVELRGRHKKWTNIQCGGGQYLRGLDFKERTSVGGISIYKVQKNCCSLSLVVDEE